jgi:hypothetical protein
MDPLQNDIWSHLVRATDVPEPAAVPGAEAAADSGPAAATAAGSTAEGEQRASDPTRRRFDRGGRRRSDWPEDAGMTCCPGCGFEAIQSLGMLDSGDYLWACPHCDRRFQTGRATRAML